MKSERRHELQNNELANVLGKMNNSLDGYAKAIVGAIAACLIGVFAWSMYSSAQSGNRSDATLQLIDASSTGNTELMAKLAAQYPDTVAAAWARVYQGGEKMAAGIGALFTSREEAEELLDEAAAAYRQGLEMSDDRVLKSRAHLGLARIAESLGKTDEAIEHYEGMIMAAESDAAINAAKDRIAVLSQPSTKEFLTWFNDQDFAPADPSLPPSLPDLGELPEVPDLKLPESLPPSEEESSN